MQRDYSQNHAESQIQVEFTDKPITAFGGMVILSRFLDKLNISDLLMRVLPDQRTSPNARPVVEIAVALLAAVSAGASRFAHVNRLRMDQALRTILGIARIPSSSTLTRYFSTFTQAQVEHMAEGLWEWTLQKISARGQHYTLDLDSSVFTRYGKQQGAKKGYNPKKPGRPSHRPIFAFIAELKIVANLWLRSGNTADLTGAGQFLSETLAKIPPHIPITALRADSGFHDQKFFQELENRHLAYAVYARMDRRIQRAIATADGWEPIDGDQNREIVEIDYQALTWDRPRRLVAVREKVRPEKDNRGKMLFDMPNYTYTAVLTSMEAPAIDVWRFYNHRADVENRIKELKEDFGADGFCLGSFFGTEAALRLIAFFYNLISLFKEHIIRDPRPTLKTIRYQVLVVGAQLGSAGRTKILRIAAKDRLRNYLKLLLDRVAIFDESQLQCS